MTRIWEPCTRPKRAKKAHPRGFDSLPWFARAEGYVMQMYRSAGRTYARITNTHKLRLRWHPVTGQGIRILEPSGIQPRASQWYCVVEEPMR